jgi:hypothetical protein
MGGSFEVDFKNAVAFAEEAGSFMSENYGCNLVNTHELA